MKTVTKTYESDASGIVHVDVAVGAAHRQVEVVLVWRDAGALAGSSGQPLPPVVAAAPLGWSPGFFDRMARVDPRDAAALKASMRAVRARRGSKKAPRL